MRSAIQMKYSLLKYYYTSMYLNSRDGTGAFYRPMWFDYEDQPKAYDCEASENILLGNSLKMSIKTSPNTDWDNESNEYWFPEGTWCDIVNPLKGCLLSDGVTLQTLPAGISDYQIHLKEGRIIPM